MHIAIIDGHPDPSKERFCHALAAAYAAGATQSGHDVRILTIADLDVPFLRSQEQWTHGVLPPQLKAPQEAVGWADHLVIVFPLWLGDMPAYLKAFLEQIARPGFAFAAGRHSPAPAQLNGKTARIIVTMGMPALVYR
jgi:putative NADPH-quinone reductase